MEAMKLSRGPMIAITALRVLVGWHFLYEGLTKLTAPSWSSAGYLRQARGPLAEQFRRQSAKVLPHRHNVGAIPTRDFICVSTRPQFWLHASAFGRLVHGQVTPT